MNDRVRKLSLIVPIAKILTPQKLRRENFWRENFGTRNFPLVSMYMVRGYQECSLNLDTVLHTHIAYSFLTFFGVTRYYMNTHTRSHAVDSFLE